MIKTEIVFQEDQMVILNKQETNHIYYKDMVGILCERPYLRLQVIDGKSMLISCCLEKMLSCLPDSFVLCNRSSIINLLHVEAYTTDRNNKGYLQLKTGTVIPVSRRKKAEIRDKFNRLLTVQHTFSYRSAYF
jgi:DNA-binding LytR/AlgR family response regulator